MAPCLPPLYPPLVLSVPTYTYFANNLSNPTHIHINVTRAHQKMRSVCMYVCRPMYGMYGRDAALESRGTAVLGPDLGAFRLFGRTYRGLQILWPHVLKTIFSGSAIHHYAHGTASLSGRKWKRKEVKSRAPAPHFYRIRLPHLPIRCWTVHVQNYSSNDVIMIAVSMSLELFVGIVVGRLAQVVFVERNENDNQNGNGHESEDDGEEEPIDDVRQLLPLLRAAALGRLDALAGAEQPADGRRDAVTVWSGHRHRP